MSGGYWYGADGERRWIDDERTAIEPEVLPIPPELVGPGSGTEAEDAGETWTPPERYQPAPIVDFVADVCGLTPWPSQAALLSELYGEPIRTAVLRLGRRSGKDRMASWIGTYEATANADAHRPHVPPGELVAVAIVANSQRQARIVHRWCRDYLKREHLEHLVVRDTDDEIELSNGMVIVTMPCTARSTRGYAIAVVIFDEAAWYVDIGGSPMSGDELWQALVPSTAQFPEGKVLVLSTPRWSTGWFADLCRQATSGEFADMRHWWATTRTMNPMIADTFLDSERRKDPAAYLREYEARFASGVGAAMDSELVRDAVRRGAATGLQPVRQTAYTVSIDPAYRRDTFALLVGHRTSEGGMVVDLARGWTASPGQPVDHRSVLEDVARISRAYGRASVVLDQFAQEPVAQGLTERGVSPIRQPWTNELKAEALALARQYLNTDRLSLPDHAPLISQLSALEQTLLPSGRPRIAAPPGQHDDFAMAFLALVFQLHTGTTLAAGSSFSMVA